MNPLILFSAFIIGTGVRSYFYGPTANSETGSDSRSDTGYEQGSNSTSSKNINVNVEDPTSYSTSNWMNSAHNHIPAQHSTYEGEYGKTLQSSSDNDYHHQTYSHQTHAGYKSEAPPSVKMVPVQYHPVHEPLTVKYLTSPHHQFIPESQQSGRYYEYL